MYRIMIARSKRSNYETMYQFVTTTTDGVTTPLEIPTKEALDARIEDMLNTGEYSKSDFIIVEVIDYSIDAKNYSDDTGDSDDDTGSGISVATDEEVAEMLDEIYGTE